jgi:hypothetical protein
MLPMLLSELGLETRRLVAPIACGVSFWIDANSAAFDDFDIYTTLNKVMHVSKTSSHSTVTLDACLEFCSYPWALLYRSLQQICVRCIEGQEGDSAIVAWVPLHDRTLN